LLSRYSKDNSKTKTMKIQKVKIASLIEVSELKNLYSEQSIDELKNSIETDGLKIPIIISENFEVVDGYRRLDALKALGQDTIDVVVNYDKATLNQRRIRNMYRVKTPDDLVNEAKIVFATYPKKQGKKYNGKSRKEIISGALGYKYKDEATQNKLEYIIKHDLVDNILTKAILGNKADVENSYLLLTKFKKISEENNYGYLELFLKGELSVKDFNKITLDRYKLDSEYKDTFVIPDKCHNYNINCIGITELKEHNNSIDLIVTSPPYFIQRNYLKGDDYKHQLGHEKTKEEFCNNIASIFNAIYPTLKETANVFINMGETYDDGVGYGIPQALKAAIEQNTKLIYKDTLIWSKPNHKPQNEWTTRPINNIEYVLWFVVTPKKAKYKNLTYTLNNEIPKISKGMKDIDKDGKVWEKNKFLLKPYKKMKTHMEMQEVENIIKCVTGQNKEVYQIFKGGHPAIMAQLLSLTMILMCSDEGDKVFDPFSGSNVVGRMAQLLNRHSIATEIDEEFFKIGCELTKQSIQEFDRDSLDYINSIAYGNSDNQFNQAA